MYSILIAITVTISCAIFIQSEKRDPEKILGIYNQPGKWYYLKYFALLLVLSLRTIRTSIFNEWLRYRSRLREVEKYLYQKLEELQPLSKHEKAYDGVSVQAVSQDGFCFYGATERVHGGKINGFFYILDPKRGLLQSEQLPNTLLDADPNSMLKKNEYSTKNISFVPVKPMKEWKICYKGKMRSQTQPENLLDVSFDGEWVSDRQPFQFNKDINDKALASSVSTEVWTKKYLRRLKNFYLKNVHYEQLGTIRGTLVIDNETKFIEMDSLRSHNFGVNKSHKIHRYVFYTMYLDNGTKICLWIVSMPSITSHLQMGYIVEPKSKLAHTIEYSDLLLYQHGEKGEPPSNIAFSFTCRGKIYEVKCLVDAKATHYIGLNKDIKVIECFVNYQVNGIDGRGISEWYYSK